MSVQYNEAKEIERAFQWLKEYYNRAIYPEYHSVATMDEAISLLVRYGDEAKIFAGGTDVIALMKSRVHSPGVLVNIKPIRKIQHITLNSAGISIGTLTHINDLERSPLIRQQYPILSEAARSIASPHIRNMATIGGNLCQETRCWYYRRPPDTGTTFNCRRKSEDGACYALNGENQYHAIMGPAPCVSVCPSDLATVLLAMNAQLKTEDHQGGRLICIDELYETLGTTLKPDEIISTIQIAKVESGVKQRFLKFRTRKAIDFAIASVAAIIKLDGKIVNDARIVLGGVSSKPYRAVKAEQFLMSEPITEVLAVEAAKRSVAEARPLSKNSYKVKILETLVKRAILE